MLTTRVIPTLLLKEWGIVKTVQFDAERYMGCAVTGHSNEFPIPVPIPSNRRTPRIFQ